MSGPGVISAFILIAMEMQFVLPTEGYLWTSHFSSFIRPSISILSDSSMGASAGALGLDGMASPSRAEWPNSCFLHRRHKRLLPLQVVRPALFREFTKRLL